MPRRSAVGNSPHPSLSCGKRPQPVLQPWKSRRSAVVNDKDNIATGVARITGLALVAHELFDGKAKRLESRREGISDPQPRPYRLVPIACR